MPLFGKIIVIKRNGTDGTHFPLTASSCLFGRKKECDIRIQLPQVSKEQCKIDVNENKEATLINLSSATPTQLNGINVQDPTYLKHGDVLTIIDRSFRFEYPPLSSPRKRLSRSQDKETLQVLHVQQEEQELLYPQDSENRNPQISEKKHEWRSQTINSSEKKTKEHTTGEYGTSESPYKICQSEIKSEMSPFSKLYELMKYEGSAKKTEENAISMQQKGCSPPKYDNFMPQASFQASGRRSIGNEINTEAGICNGVSHSGDIKGQEINSVISNPVSFYGNSSRRSYGRGLFTSVQSYGTKQKEGCEDGNHLNICNTEENELENANTVFKATRQSEKYFPQSCCITSLDSTDTTECLNKALEQTTGKADVDIKTKVIETAKSNENVLLTPKSEKDIFQLRSSPCIRSARRSSSKFKLQQVELDSLIEMNNYSGTSSETEKYPEHICMEGHEFEILVKNRYSKIMEGNIAMATEPIQAVKETKMEIGQNHIPKDGNSRTPHHSNKSRSPRMITEKNKRSSSRSSFIKHITTEDLLVIPTDPSGTSRTTPVQVHDASVGRDWLQEEEDKIKQPTAKGHDQNVDTKNAPVSSNQSEGGHGNGTGVSDEAVSESEVSGPLIAMSEIKKSPQKRKSTELHLLTQPLGKRKRVSFGGHLSPELFDKRLPPNSPLKRGAIPARLSLPFGNSPRAVLKKASGLRQSVTKDQHKTTLMKKVASPPSRRSPAHRSPATSPPARRSPATSPPARRSPATSPTDRRSTAASPPAGFSCNTPQRKGRFSVSRVTCPSSEEQVPIATQIHLNKKFDEVKTPESINPVSKAACSVRRSKTIAPRRSSLHRCGTVDAINSKRRSGASEANLIVAKSWAEVVKQGVPKSLIKTTRTKCDVKRRSLKKIPTKPTKNNVSILKTPVRKIKDHFTTGHANSPAPILIGKAHSRIMNLAAQVPKVMFNYPLKQQHDLNESFTGMAEMFTTPPKGEQAPLKGEEKSSLSSGQITTPEVISEMHSPGKSGEASTTPVNKSNQQRLCKNKDSACFLNEMPQVSSLAQDDLQMTPGETSSSLEVTVRKNSSFISVNEKTAAKDKSPEQKSETIEGHLAVKKILRTPKQKRETLEALSGLRRILRTPKPKTEPVEALSAVKRILKTPKEKMEPVEALSAVKRILRTPKEKTEPVEALSAVKRILRTPKEKTEPVEALSGIKRILRTPKQKMEPVEALSGVKRTFRTPKQKMEPIEALSGVKGLFSTPKENLDFVVDDIICSKLIKTPEEALMGSSKKRHRHIIQLMGSDADEIPKEKVTLVEDLEGLQRQLRTPKQRSEPMEDLVGISRLFKTPRQKFLPVDDYLGLQKLMAESKQSYLSPEIDYTGVKEMLDTPSEHKGEILKSANIMEEDIGPCIDSRNKREHLENESGSKEAKLETSSEIKIPFTIQRDHECVAKLEDSPLNELKTESTETKCMPESCQPNEIESLNADKTDFVKEPAANLDPKDKEMAEPLASGRRTRKRKADEPNTTIEQTRKVQKHTRNSHRAKSDKYVKNNDNEQSIAESSAYESHMPVIESVTKILSREKSRKHSIETNNSMQNKDFETSEVESIGNSIRKRNTRGKATPLKTEIEILNTAINKNKNGSTKYTASKMYKIEALENNTAVVKENAVRKGRGKKVKFLLEKHNSMSLEDKCVLRDNSGIPEEERSSFSESSTSSASRRSKRKASVVPQQLCFSLLEEKHTEICGNKDKKGIKLSFENITLTKDDPSVVSASFFQGKNVQEIQVEGCPNETQKVPLESIQTPALHSPQKRQDVAKENLPRRGRSRQTISHEICTKYDRKHSSAMEKQNVVATSEDNRPKRGRGRIASAFQVPLLLEDITHAKEGPKKTSISSAQQIQKEENPDETPKEPVGSIQSPTEYPPARRQRVVKENPPRRGRSKQTISHETSTECDSKKATETIDCNMGVTINENQQKRVRKKRVVPVLQEDSLTKEDPIAYSFSSAKGEFLQQIQNEEFSNESQKVPREVVQIPTEHSPPRRQKDEKENLSRRGRRKQVISHEASTEYESKQAAEIIDCNIVVTTEEKQPKWSRGKRVVPVLQTPLLMNNIAFAKEGPKTDNFNSAQDKCSLQHIQNEANPSETQETAMEIIEIPAEHSPPKRLKIAKEERGRRQAIYQETLTECERKQTALTKNEKMVAKNADSTKKSESRKGRGRKIAPVSQTLFSPLKNNSLILPPSIKSKSAVEQPSGVFETAVAASENLSHRGRRKKTEDITATGSAPTRKKSQLLDKDKEEKMPKDLTEENVSKRGRRKQLVLHETSTISYAQLENSENAISISDKTVHLEIGFEKKNQSKRNRKEQNVLASELLPSLKVSISLPSSSDKDRPDSENPSTLTENVREGNQTKRGRNNNKIVECTMSVRRNKPTEEVFQEKDLEKKILPEKQCRRGRKKVDAFESTVSVSLKKDGSTAGSCVASEDQQEVLDNTASSKKVASNSRGQKFHKGKNTPKDSDSEFSAQGAKKNSSKMGRRKQVKNISETSTATSDVAEGFIAENKSRKSRKEKAESTALRKGKKMKEDHSTPMIEPAAETEGRTRGSRRTRK